MVIVYRGKVEEVRRELDRHKEALNRRYVEVLGNERANKVRYLADVLLKPTSFFDSPESFLQGTSHSIRDRGNNLMGIVGLDECNVDPEGNVKDDKWKIAPTFYISEQGFRNSGSKDFTDNPLASYVHEFDHFVWFALQKTPITIVELLLNGATVDTNGKGTQYAEKEGDPTLSTIANIFGIVLNDIHEAANRILDRQILSSIGIDVPLPWRGQRKEYGQRRFREKTVVVPTGGDPFYGLNDEEVIERFMSWETYFSSTNQHPYITNLVRSAQEMRIVRIPFEDLMRQSKAPDKKRKK